VGVTEKFYAYLVTEVTGTQVGKIEPGQHFLEREYKGSGEYTWTIFDFGKNDMPLTATITGIYIGIVHGIDGKLTEESRELLAAYGRSL
jgi:hypothetical protein